MSNRKSKTVSELLQDANATECDEMLGRFMRDRGIEAGDYKSLAHQLAIKHEPEFRHAPLKLEHDTYGAVIQKEAEGRPKDWTLDKFDALAAGVADAKKNPDISTDDATIRHLIAKGGPWARPANRDLNQWAKTLKNRLGEARRFQRGADHLLALVKQIQPSNPEK